VVECVANLLKLDTYQLADSLTQRFMVLRGEQITTPLTIEQVSNLLHLPQRTLAACIATCLFY